MTRKIQPSFSSGELAPELHGRVDTTKYQSGLARARNVFIHTFGGLSNRAGTRFVASVIRTGHDVEDTAARLITFLFSRGDAYVLEFGDRSMRVMRNGGHVLGSIVSGITATSANPGIFRVLGGHGFETSDEVFFLDFQEMIELNRGRYIIERLSSTTFSLKDQVTLGSLDTREWSAETTGGNGAKIYTIDTPYARDELQTLKYVQRGDVMTITHLNHKAHELRRYEHDDWRLTPVVFKGIRGGPIGITLEAIELPPEPEVPDGNK